ncbi:MAG TPA: response regulator [Oculatellaceae cyanobacterium]|jgi:two-component system sensor histidine kinase and response regulator WspE
MTNNQYTNDFSMLDIFRMETENQATILTNNILAIESNSNLAETLESLRSAARSIKGAAKIVQIQPAIAVAYALETCFVAAQRGIALTADNINVLLQAVDLLVWIAQVEEAEQDTWLSEHQLEVESTLAAIAAISVQQPTNPTPLLEGETIADVSPQPIAEDGEPSPTPSPEVTDLIPTTSLSASFNLSDLSMLHLFRMEAESQAAVLNEGLLALETNPNANEALESSMRAAHSIKGAARIVGLDAAVKLAHIMEDCFTAAQKGEISLTSDDIDILLQAVDVLLRLSQVSETQAGSWLTEHYSEIETLVAAISVILKGQELPTNFVQPLIVQDTSLEDIPVLPPANLPAIEPAVASEVKTELLSPSFTPPNSPTKSQIPNSKSTRVVRVSAENLNRLMGLAGESLVEANWLQPFADSLMKLRSKQAEVASLLEKLQESLGELPANQASAEHLSAARQKANECRQVLGDRMGELEQFARRSANLSDRLYREVIASHMRPFADGVQGFPRMVRDLARQLGKQVKLEIIGKSTQVDRDILEKLEAPLTHILRNALDHGLEMPEERIAAGKPATGTVRIEASHRAGMLLIAVSDDGHGVKLEELRQKIVAKNMIGADMAAQLTEAELMEFLFLPGFSTASKITEVSGRGVGLDVAQSMVQEVGGVLRAVSQRGSGMSFYLQLPLTLSVIRTLLVEISGEPYAFPLTRIERILMLPQSAIAIAENRQYFTLDHQNIGLVAAHQVLELDETALNSEALSVVIISDRLNRYGVVVDKFLGERKLVVRPLDARLGKVKDISAAALMEDGTPVLIIDVEDIIRSIDNLLTNGQINKVSNSLDSVVNKTAKRILVVDDSITVREMERKLLENRGYEVEVAVNGMDGWNALRTGHYNLVVTDIDMPRMNGIELVSHIKNNHNFKNIPVIIVSYKDREEDRIRGLEVGANYYLTKSSFHDDTLLKAVNDLIGEAV